MSCVALKLTSLVKFRFSSFFNYFKSWSQMYFYPYRLKVIVSSVLYIIHIQAFKLLIIVFVILLENPFHANRYFVLMSSTCSLYLSEVLTTQLQGIKTKMFCIAMRNNCYNEYVAINWCIWDKCSNHLDEFQCQKNVGQHYLIYQQWSSGSCRFCRRLLL